MHVYPNALRKQAHLHLANDEALTEASLIHLSGERTPVQVKAHGQHHYLLRWSQELPAGLYQVAVRTQAGQMLQAQLRLS